MKKTIELMSIRTRARARVRCSFSSSSLAAVNQLPVSQRMPRPEQDAHEGRQVRHRLKTGTGDQDADPHEEHQVALECGAGGGDLALDFLGRDHPLAAKEPAGDRQRDDQVDDGGQEVAFMIPSVVIWPPIQSIVVVTSPIGDQAPPALAAMTMLPAKKRRSSCLSSSFFISEIITIVVVRLSSTELRKKVVEPTSHISEERLVAGSGR